MKKLLTVGLVALLTPSMMVVSHAAATGSAFYGDPPDATHAWAVHDRNRPQPPVVTPGEGGAAPSDAVVLFGGADLQGWESTKNGGGGPATWVVRDGYMEAVKGAGTIRTKDQFGDCQLHLEWAAPEKVSGSSQGRGNSGVFFMERAEVQILDAFNNLTYADGTVGSLYGVHPPLANALRPPGEFNVYDIVFRRPILEDGKVIDTGRITVFCNGVLVQDSTPLEGPGSHRKRSVPVAFPDRGAISLQDHGNPVRFRNIWVRELPPRIIDGGTEGGPLSPEAVTALRARTAGSLREAAESEAVARVRLLLLLESLTYEEDATVAAKANELLAGWINDLEYMDDQTLNKTKGSVLELNKALAYLAKHRLFAAPDQQAALDQLIKQQGWDKK